MGLDEIVEQILMARRDLKREEVLRMIEEKKMEAEGYFTDEGAARLVASEVGVEVFREPFQPEILIRDLVSGLNDVTITGRVITVYSPKTFTRPDRTEGKVVHLLIADSSGTLNVVLWDDKVSLVEDEKIKEGEIIRVSHGYVREGFDGKPELHVGLRGAVQISPPGVVDQEYPPLARFLQKIGEVTKEHAKASILGTVQRISPVSTFERRDGTQGKVRRLQLRDETGQITVVLWNNKVDELGDVKTGDHLKIVDGRVKENVDGRLEIHTKNATKIEILTGVLPPRFTKIKDLRPNMRDVDVLARVAHVGRIREFTRRSGEKGRVSTLLVKDETGFVRLNLWEDKTAISRQIRPGDILLAEKAYTRERFGEINLNVGRRGVLTLNPEVAEAEKPPPYEEKTTKIIEIEEEGGPVTVEGILETAPEIREVTTTRGEKVFVASFELGDDTGKIRVSLWRRLVDTIKDLTVGNRIKISNAYVKRGFSDQLELTSRVLTSVEIKSKGETPLS